MFFLKALGYSGVAGALVLHHVLQREEEERARKKYKQAPSLGWMPPSREAVLAKSKKNTYDMVIVGGGSVGSGCALDAATRGYSVLLLEKEDFGSGTSSKSTKLIHGGIRYLEKAVKELDYRQLSLVVEGLRERKTFLSVAPYLTREVGILLPIKHKYMIPYFWLGTKMYDWLSGAYSIQRSYFLGKGEVARMFPAINQKKLAGSMVYFDGQMDDTRVNAMLVETAVYHGADALNYAEVVSFTKNNGKIESVLVKDTETGNTHAVRTRGVINATGPHTDTIRALVHPGARRVMAPSLGVHMILGEGYTGKIGLLNPSTHNGSVLFVLPWNNRSIVGTTDTPAPSTERPMPRAEDIRYLTKEMGMFINRSLQPRARNILSAWAGVRPLATDPSCTKKGSQALVRSHLIETLSPGLVTITGGKWTSYREMAEEAVTHSARVFGLPERPSATRHVCLIGSHMYTPTLPTKLAREFGIPEDIAAHLVSTYGDRARKVCAYAENKYARIDGKHAYIEAELAYGADHEHVRTVADFLGRRSLFAYVDVRSAHASVPKIASLLGAHLNWGRAQRKAEIKRAYEYLDTMGYSLLRKMEAEEDTFACFKAKLEKLCTNQSTCQVSKASGLLEKYFGAEIKKKLVSDTKGRPSVQVEEIVQSVLLHTGILA
ncbi:glycerol-3-phosphate dehydrogenase [Nematocida sp. AWRm77]|nr:glycerol-3-phosphate dehydrogenase [Nematocida sp. AWRm77]